MHAARDTFRNAYRQLVRHESGQWRPQGMAGIVRPSVVDYPSVEIHPNGDVFGVYKDLQKYARECGLTGRRRVDRATNVANATIEAHHLLEDRLMQAFGITQNEGWCVAVEWGDHSLLSAELPRHLPKKTYFEIDDVFDAHATMYREHQVDDWVLQARRFLLLVRDRILGAYETRLVPSASDRDFATTIGRVREFLQHLS